MNNILITGGTGFLGSQLIDEMLSSSEDVINALVRDRDADTGRERLLSILRKLHNNGKDLDPQQLERIHVYKGDIANKDLFSDQKTQKDLIQNTDIIYHGAAATDLNLPLRNAREINVGGTRNVLDFALACKEKGRLKKVNYISTTYVAGTHGSIFRENDLDVGQRFNNSYEQSKYDAEALVLRYRQLGLDVDIIRPSVILGRYSDGMTTNFKMFYQPLHFFSLQLFERIPALADSRVNLINVDTVARAIIAIAKKNKEVSKSYHIASQGAPTLTHILDIGSDFFGFKKPELVPSGGIDIVKEYTPIQRKLINPFVPYFNYKAEFNTQNTMSKLKRPKVVFPDFDESNLIRLFKYCNKVGFIKRKKKY